VVESTLATKAPSTGWPWKVCPVGKESVVIFQGHNQASPCTRLSWTVCSHSESDGSGTTTLPSCPWWHFRIRISPLMECTTCSSYTISSNTSASILGFLGRPIIFMTERTYRRVKLG